LRIRYSEFLILNPVERIEYPASRIEHRAGG